METVLYVRITLNALDLRNFDQVNTVVLFLLSKSRTESSLKDKLTIHFVMASN